MNLSIMYANNIFQYYDVNESVATVSIIVQNKMFLAQPTITNVDFVIWEMVLYINKETCNKSDKDLFACCSARQVLCW